MQRKKIGVIGAGPAGLTAAYLLAKSGEHVTVFESDPKYVGGISRTESYKGFLFDIGGHRLGRGGGAYDRMLTALKRQATFVGLAFELQILERLPTDEWDQQIHYLITEKRIIDCGTSVSSNRDLIVS